MENNNQEPVQVLLTYNPNNSGKNKLRAEMVTTEKRPADKITRLDENDKLVRRYSFDDNGGSYQGL